MEDDKTGVTWLVTFSSDGDVRDAINTTYSD